MNTTQPDDAKMTVQKQLDGLDRLSDELSAEIMNNRSLLWALIEIHPNVAELKARLLELHARSMDRLFVQSAQLGLPPREAYPLHSLLKQDGEEITSYLTYLEQLSSSDTP